MSMKEMLKAIEEKKKSEGDSGNGNGTSSGGSSVALMNEPYKGGSRR